MKSKMVFFFGYSWTKERNLDAYQQSIADGFIKQGFEVRVYCANLFSKSHGVYGIVPVFEKKLLNEIRKYKPKYIFSMNFGLLSDAVCESLPEQTKVFTWVVDDIDHLFRPNAKTARTQELGKIHPKIGVYTFSSTIFEYFKKNHPELQGDRLIFSASVTEPTSFGKVAASPQRNIVFIGTYLNTSLAIRLMLNSWRDERLRGWILQILTLMEKNYSDPQIDQLLQDPMIHDFLKQNRINSPQLKLMLSNLISANRRVEMVRTLNPLGIQIFGNVAWINGLASSLENLRCLQADVVGTRDDLVRIYQSSRIAVQVPQIQVGGALSYRVFDILASASLLIHPYHPDSDLYRYFGKDCPVPTYRNNKELFELCQYYLENEEERLSLVRRCNALVEEGFSFDQRVSEMTGVGLADLSIQRGAMLNIYSRRSEISNYGILLDAFDFFYRRLARLIR